MESKKLEMEFLTGLSRKFVIGLDDPKFNLSKEEVETAMEAIIAENVFIVSLANLVEPVEARIVTTSIEKLTE